MPLRLDEAIKGIAQTFSKPKCVMIGVVSTLATILIASWVANAKVLAFVLESPLLSPGMKLWTVTQQLASTFVAFHPVTVALIFTTALLFGANIALSACYVSRRYALGRSMGMTLVGALVAMLGVGCASCGSVLLLSIFGSSAAAVVIKHLPLEGLEFGIIGCVVMLISIYLTAVKIPAAEACAIPPRK